MIIESPITGLTAEFRKLKGAEIAALAADADGDAAMSGISTVVAGCWQATVNPGPYPFIQAGDARPDVARLAKGDLLYLLIRLRAASLSTPDADPGPWGPGDAYVFPVQCPVRTCRNRRNWKVLLSKLPIQPMPAASRDKLRQGLPFAARFGGKLYEWGPATFAREQPAAELRRRQKRVTPTMLDRLAAQTYRIDGGKADIASRYKHFVDLDQDELLEIQAAYDASDGGIDTEILVKCSACGFEAPEDLPFERSFFNPRHPSVARPKAPETPAEEPPIEEPEAPPPAPEHATLGDSPSGS